MTEIACRVSKRVKALGPEVGTVKPIRIGQKEEVSPVTVRWPAAVWDRVRQIADENGCSINQAAVDLMAWAVEAYEDQKKQKK